MKIYIFFFLIVIFVGSVLNAITLVIPSRDVSKIVTQGATTIVRSTSGKVFVYTNENLTFEYTQKGYSDFLLLENTLLLWTVRDTTKILEYDIKTHTKKASYAVDEKIETLLYTPSQKILILAEKRKFAVITAVHELNSSIEWEKSQIPLWRENVWMYNGEIYYYHNAYVYRFVDKQFLPYLNVPDLWYVHHNDRIAIRDKQGINVYNLETKALVETFAFDDKLKECTRIFVYTGKIIGVSHKTSYSITSEGIKSINHTEVIRFVTENDFILESDAEKYFESVTNLRISRCLPIGKKIAVLLHEKKAFGTNKSVLKYLD